MTEYCPSHLGIIERGDRGLQWCEAWKVMNAAHTLTRCNERCCNVGGTLQA